MGCGSNNRARLTDFRSRDVVNSEQTQRDEWVFNLFIFGTELKDAKIQFTCKTTENRDCPDSFALLKASTAVTTPSTNNGSIVVNTNEATHLEAVIRIPRAGDGFLIQNAKHQETLFFDVQIQRDTTAGTPNAPTVETVLRGQFYLVCDITQTNLA